MVTNFVIKLFCLVFSKKVTQYSGEIDSLCQQLYYDVNQHYITYKGSKYAIFYFVTSGIYFYKNYI